jgi:alkylated DNA repair dioxygenase AlkB
MTADDRNPGMHWQPSLFGGAAPDLDQAFAGAQRTWLDVDSWIDLQRGWVTGADALFQQVVRTHRWGQRTRWMYDKQVLEPRLTAAWHADAGEPLVPALVERMRAALSLRYGVTFDSVGFNLYRDGRDSVAWHRDKISAAIAEPVVALVSLGEPRRFLLRPRGGGSSLAFDQGGGDLLVTGGRTQRTWEHCVPKVARAGPRISLAFLHGLLRAAYGGQQ